MFHQTQLRLGLGNNWVTWAVVHMGQIRTDSLDWTAADSLRRRIADRWGAHSVERIVAAAVRMHWWVGIRTQWAATSIDYTSGAMYKSPGG